MKPVTLADVARMAGVSPSAVSRTFTSGASVSDATRHKVEQAAEQLGYRPSLIARSLATNRTKLIGLIANNFQNPVFLEVFDLYTRELQNEGFQPLIVNLTDGGSPEHWVQMMRQYHVDGVIIATSTLTPGFAEAFLEVGVPLVHAFGRFDPSLDIHVVGIDNIACGRMAAEIILARGCRSVAVIGGPEYATSTQDRVAGFTRRMAELGGHQPTIRFAENYTYAAGRAAMAALLEQAEVDAVFCGDDLICMGAMDAARAAGLSIPDRICFLGFNDMSMAAWDAYDLTTIRQPVADIILASIRLVTGLAKHGAIQPSSTVLPCTLVERGTLRPLQ